MTQRAPSPHPPPQPASTTSPRSTARKIGSSGGAARTGGRSSEPGHSKTSRPNPGPKRAAPVLISATPPATHEAVGTRAGTVSRVSARPGLPCGRHLRRPVRPNVPPTSVTDRAIEPTHLTRRPNVNQDCPQNCSTVLRSLTLRLTEPAASIVPSETGTAPADDVVTRPAGASEGFGGAQLNRGAI